MAGDDGSLRRVRTRPQGARDKERELLDAVLELVGERGYVESSLSALLERSGSSSRNFHRHFDSLADCYEHAYVEAASGLCKELIAVGRQGADWRTGFRAALLRLLQSVAAEPRRARALLIEWRVAGEGVVSIHEELAGLIAVEIERARKEIGEQGRQPPPMSARIVLGAVEYKLVELIETGKTEGAERLLGSLAYFAVLIYFGREAAVEELGNE
jgi:AcrR family transcriptional regulator